MLVFFFQVFVERERLFTGSTVHVFFLPEITQPAVLVMAYMNLLCSMLFFLLSSLDFDLGRSKQQFYKAEKGARMISLSYTLSSDLFSKSHYN